MFARAISTILAIIAIALFAYSHFYETDNPVLATYAIVPFIIAALIFIMAPQINWWWYTKNPPSIDSNLKTILQTRLSFYQNLSEADKSKFEKRVTLFIMAKQFTPKIHDEVPEDMKAIIAASAVMLTFHKEEDWLFDKFEQYIIYPHPFPTPQYEEWHICENFEEDGVMLFSAQHLLHGFFEPQKYYQIALHEFVNVFLDNYLGTKYPQFGEDNWVDFEKISNFSEEKIKAYIGLQNVSPTSVGTTLFFTHREYFAQVLPREFETLQKIFG